MVDQSRDSRRWKRFLELIYRAVSCDQGRIEERLKICMNGAMLLVLYQVIEPIWVLAIVDVLACREPFD